MAKRAQNRKRKTGGRAKAGPGRKRAAVSKPIAEKAPETTPRLYLVSGIPGAGKSHFCRWLADTRGFRHVDVDHEQRYGELDQALADGLNTGSPASLIAYLGADQPCIVDWEFPISWLPFIRSMKGGGFSIWWFEADAAQARALFIARDELGKAWNFDRQTGEINSHRGAIESVFRPNIITALRPDGSRLAYHDIAVRMGLVTGTGLVGLRLKGNSNE